MAVAEVAGTSRDPQFEAAVEELRTAVEVMAGCIAEAEGQTLGEALIQIREAGIDPLKAALADGVLRFDKPTSAKT